MKVFALIFGAFFLIFFALGFINGKAKVSSKEFTEQYTISKLQTIYSDNRYFLAYKIQQGEGFVYDIDREQLIRIDRFSFIGNTKNVNSRESILDYVGTNSASFIGAGTGFLGYTIKDVLKTMPGAETSISKKIIFKFIAAISGAAAGYYIGNYCGEKSFLPSPTSTEIQNLLTKTENWNAWRERVLRYQSGEVEEYIWTIYGDKNETFHSARMFYSGKKYRDLSNHIMAICNHQPISSQDFGEILKLKKELEPRYQLEKPDEPIDYYLIAHCVMPCLVLLALLISSITVPLKNWLRTAPIVIPKKRDLRR